MDFSENSMFFWQPKVKIQRIYKLLHKLLVVVTLIIRIPHVYIYVCIVIYIIHVPSGKLT